MNRQSVLVDFDGVIINLLGSVKEILAERNITFNENNITSYKFDGNIGCDKKEVYALFNDVDTFKRAIPYNGAISALTRLKQYVNVHPFTCVANNEKIFTCRSKLIEELGFNSHVTTPYIGLDKPIKTGYDAIFEDDPTIAEKYAKIGTQVYLIDHTYNRDLGFNDYIRCGNFVDAVNKYLSTLNIKKVS